MVRNRPSKRSSVCKTKAGSQISSLQELTLLDGPLQKESLALLPEPFQSGNSQLGLADSVYLLAAAIFQNNHLVRPAAHRLVNYGKRLELPLPKVKDEAMQKKAYELAFNTLKYQELLEDIMIDSCFCLAQPMPDDQMSLVTVILYDLQDRKFLPWERQGEEFIQEVRDVEGCLLRFKTKLAASVARWRIKHGLLTIDSILPESVRKKQERASSLPLYAWINTLKSSLDEVCGVLKTAGFSQVKSIRQGHTFYQDPHCEDTLVFPAQVKADLHRTKLLDDHNLIIQDKSCCLGPHAVYLLLSGEEDVLMVGCFSGLTVSHTASQITLNQHASNSKNQSKVYVCVGDRSKEELQEAVNNIGCRNVKLIPEVFQSLDCNDTRLQKVRVILLTPQCSLSAISNPVDFILQENGDTDLLQDLSQGSIAQSKLEALVAQQRKDIDHALKFPKVQSVVYSTCSSYPEENEEVVRRALELSQAWSEQEGEQAFKLITTLHGYGLAKNSEVMGPFFRLEPSEQSNGCFLAILTREPEPVVEETAQEVLARANKKGLLDRIGTNPLTKKEYLGYANRMGRATHPHTSQSRNCASNISTQSRANQPRNYKIKGSASATMFEQQEVSSGRLSLQGKAKASCRQAPNSTVSTSSTSSKLAQFMPCKRATCLISTTMPTNGHPLSTTPMFNSRSTPTQCPALSAQAAAAAQSPKVHQEVLRPMAINLPPAQFPNYFPPKYSRTGGSVSCSPTPVSPMRSRTSLNKQALVKPKPWL